MPSPLPAIDVEHFRAFGFVVLRGALDAEALAAELDRALAVGSTAARGTGVARVEYVPMMVAGTPQSLFLLDRFEAAAALLLDGPVVPIRAKGVRYHGSTAWHADSSDAIVRSLGFAAYLEPLDASTGALRVVPGSHRADFGAAVRDFLAGGAGTTIDSLPGVSIVTRPGDVIVFDEHLVHASAGGSVRRQWRVDYAAEPRSAADEAALRSYLARIFPPDWDGGYDVDRFPSYGSEWLASGRPAVERLRRLGAYELASVQEEYARSRLTPRR